MDTVVRNLAYATACGAHGNRWIQSTNPNDYQSAKDASAVFADVVGDTISINQMYPKSGFYSALLASLCGSVVSSGYITSTNPADYTETVNAIATFYNKAITGIL